MQHDAQDLLEQFVGPSGTHRDNSLDLHHRERADVVFTCVDGRSVLAHAPVLRAGSLVLDDRLRGAVPTECGADDILRVPIEVAVESASLHPVLCWMYGHGVSLPKVRRLLLGASDHVVLRGACALAQKWGLKGFVQALEDAAFGVGGVQACEALGTTRPLLRAAVENWLPSGDTVRALGAVKEVQGMGGPWRELLQVIAHRMVHHVEGIGSLGETLEQAIPLLAEEPLAPFRELCTELVCVAVSFCGHCFWSWSWLRKGYPAQWRWVLDTLLKGVSPDAAAWFVRASCEEGEVSEAEVDRAHRLVPLETTITRDWGHASALLGVHAISVHSAECMRRVIFTARALWKLERTPWPLHSPVKDACLEDPGARIFVLRKGGTTVLLFLGLEADETAEQEGGEGSLLHGMLWSVTVLCIDAANRTSSLHEARFFDGPVPCMCLFQHTEGDALLPGLSLRASNERETPMLLRLDRMSVMEWDPSEGEEYEAGECCRLCVGDSLQHKLDTPLPGWAALPLEAEGDEEAESVALKDGLAVFALEEKEKGGSGHE